MKLQKWSILAAKPMTAEVSGAGASFLTKARLELRGWNWSRVGHYLPVPSAAGGHCAAEAPIAAARWCGRALLGTPSLPVGVARRWPAPHWHRTRTELQKYPANYLTPSRSRLLCAASSEQPEPSLHQAPPRFMVRDFSNFCSGYPSPEIMKGHVTWHSRRGIHDLKAPAS